jgi:SOS-response transcriptional repressor LexA
MAANEKVRKLSPRQQDIFVFISNYIKGKGFPPSLADIGRGLELSVTSVATYLNIMKKKGVLSSEERTARSIRLYPKNVDFSSFSKKKYASCRKALR